MRTSSSPPASSDLDGDGWSAPDDCDDGDAQINPDAVDVPYNGVDEDCSGADERDVDGDGYEATEVGGDDCGDGNAQVHPSAEELCDNGGDEDCDTEIDEGCSQIADPGDPGGLSWACGLTGGAPSLFFGVFGLMLALSRVGCARPRR